MATRISPLSIYDYTDYQLYLKDFYSAEKSRHRHFSYRTFAQKAATPPSLLKDIITGRRRLTLPMARKFGVAIGLSGREQEYFSTMVRFVNAKDNAEKNQCFNQMVRMRGQAGIRFMGQEHYEFFHHWYHSAVRELTTLPDFEEDPEWIASRLKPAITPAQAKKALQTLEKSGLLVRTQSGRLQPHDAVISSEYEMSSQVVRDFNRQMIHNGLAALEEFPVEMREVSGLTLGLSKGVYNRIKQRIRFFKEELLAMTLEDTGQSDLVCQFNVQLFPLIGPDGAEKKESRHERDH